MLKRPARTPRSCRTPGLRRSSRGRPYVLGCCFATRPSPQDLKLRRVVRSHDLRLTWIKAWESCADRQLHSLLPAYLNPVPKHGQDG